MIREGLEQGIVAIAAGGISAGAVLLRLMLSGNYRRLVRASNSMADVKKKWLRQLKMKFETMYQVGIGVNNVDIFVDKYINQRKILGMNLSTWESISGQATLLCGVSAAGAVLFGMYYDCGQAAILSTVMAGIGGMALIRFVDNFSCLDAKKKQLRRNLTDYFENYSKVRLERELEERAVLPADVVMETNELEGEASLVFGMENEEAAPALAEDVDFIKEEELDVQRMEEGRRGEKARRKQEKQALRNEVKECKRRQKEEREEMRLKMKEEQANLKQESRKKSKSGLESSEEETLEEVRRRREEKQKERKQRALEELRQMNQGAQGDSEAASDVGGAKEARVGDAGYGEMGHGADGRMDAEGKDKMSAVAQESGIGESAVAKELTPAEEIMKSLKLDTLQQSKKQSNKEEDKLIEEVLREFLA